MKTRLHTLTAITSALFLAIFLSGLFPAAAIASGYHYKHSDDKALSKKGSFEKWSKKGWSGKKCAKKKEKCDNSLSIPLYVKGDKRVGKVTVRLESGDLKVSYKVKKGWYIKQTNLDVSDNYNGLPLNTDGSPDVEAYQYNSKYFTPVKSADYSISASQWPLGTDLYVAAQAVVINKTHGKCKQYSAKTSYSKKSYSKENHSKKGRGKKHHSDDDDHDDDSEHHDKHDHKHHDHDHQGKSKEMEAWALGEKFPGQPFAGYFIYKLESCDPLEKSIIQFSDAIYTVKEEGPVAVITVNRSGNLDLAASVAYTTIDGSAVNGMDYEFASGELNFEPGQTSAEFEVTPIDDGEVEPLESLSLQLSNPLGAKLGQQKMATLEIEDNDQASVAVIAIDKIIPNPVDEGASVTIYVTRTGNLNVDATVDYGTIDGTAIGATQCGAPASPVPFDYQHVGGTLFFDAGVSELQIEVTTCNNNPRNDSTETFDIEIYNPMGAELADDGDGDPNSNLETITIIEGS
jgi:hypothetical protein